MVNKLSQWRTQKKFRGGRIWLQPNTSEGSGRPPVVVAPRKHLKLLKGHKNRPLSCTQRPKICILLTDHASMINACNFFTKNFCISSKKYCHKKVQSETLSIFFSKKFQEGARRAMWGRNEQDDRRSKIIGDKGFILYVTLRVTEVRKIEMSLT